MKKIAVLFFFFLPILTYGQVVTFPKTLPQKAFSVGAAGVYNNDVFAFDNEGISFYIHAGYGIRYALDINVKYNLYLNGKDYLGVDLQYLFYETRKSYFSVITGLHIWENPGFDLTGVFTYAMRYWLNLSTGLDIDLDFTAEVTPRFWIPLNAGVNAGERTFVYLEYNLPVSERAWGYVALGANIIIR